MIETTELSERNRIINALFQALMMCNLRPTQRELSTKYLMRNETFLSRRWPISNDALLNMYINLDQINHENKNKSKSMIWNLIEDNFTKNLEGFQKIKGIK